MVLPILSDRLDVKPNHHYSAVLIYVRLMIFSYKKANSAVVTYKRYVKFKSIYKIYIEKTPNPRLHVGSYYDYHLTVQ